MRVRAILACLAGGLAVATAGCAGDDDPGTPALTPADQAGEGGTLVWAVADRVESVDPLGARTRAAQILTRQIHEPLIQSLAGPFGDTRRQPGLARSARSSRGGLIWTLKLRTGVRFQDGSPFNAAAVQANADRWLATADGQELLPDLAAVDSPSPSVVRFILAAPDPNLPRRLTAPQLGIVSPRALAAGFGTLGDLRREAFSGTGTGAFELREVTPDELLLARNTVWWGSARKLGPALEQILLRIEPKAPVRLALLDAGEVQLADELTAEQARFARANPRLAAIHGPEQVWLGLERSVRGVESASEIPSLAGAWLTTVTVPE